MTSTTWHDTLDRFSLVEAPKQRVGNLNALPLVILCARYGDGRHSQQHVVQHSTADSMVQPRTYPYSSTDLMGADSRLGTVYSLHICHGRNVHEHHRHPILPADAQVCCVSPFGIPLMLTG